MLDARFRSDTYQKILFQNKSITETDEGTWLTSCLVNTVSIISGVSNFITDRPRNVFCNQLGCTFLLSMFITNLDLWVNPTCRRSTLGVLFDPPSSDTVSDRDYLPRNGGQDVSGDINGTEDWNVKKSDFLVFFIIKKLKQVEKVKQVEKRADTVILLLVRWL